MLVTGLVFMNYTDTLVDQFTFMMLLATLTTVVPYAFAAAAEIALFIKEPERFTGRKMVRDVDRSRRSGSATRSGRCTRPAPSRSRRGTC